MTKQPIFGERVVRDPAVMVGKPVVKGTRIPVERVIDHLAGSPDLADLLAAYPELTIEDVQACLAYASAAVAACGQVYSHEVSNPRPARV